MTDLDELKIILSGLLHMIYPDRTMQVIKSLCHMCAGCKEILQAQNLSATDEDLIEAIAKSLAYAAIHGKVENE